jgi:spore germination protein KC
MKKIAVIFITCSFLLAGCWDEQLYKEISIVPLFGIEEEDGKFTGYYSFSEVANESISYATVEGTGVSARDTRFDANLKTSEILDLSHLQVLLITAETAKSSDIVKTLDVIYRTPRNRMSARVAVVEGEMAPYMEKSEKLTIELPDYYHDILESDIVLSVLPDIDIQKAARRLIDEGIDLTLPFIKMSEKTGNPEVSGIALFSGKVFT